MAPSLITSASLRILFLFWQTALKLLAGNDEELFHIIPVLIGCEDENIAEGNLIETARVRELVKLLKEPAFSRLTEVSNLHIRASKIMQLVDYYVYDFSVLLSFNHMFLLNFLYLICV